LAELGAWALLHLPAALKEVAPLPSLAVIEIFAAFKLAERIIALPTASTKKDRMNGWVLMEMRGFIAWLFGVVLWLEIG
jgi:uncharacterized membrane protein HdeD (DUF308 family)